jgi:hypothetical protein
MNRNSSGPHDVWIYRICVLVLGTVVLLSMAGSIMLSVYGQKVPDMVVVLGSAAVGSLAGLLVPSPISKR